MHGSLIPLSRYYLSQQLHPVVSRLCDPLEGTDASRLALALGLDPSDYKHHRSSGGGDDAERNAANLSEEDRFRECDRLKIKCAACGEETVLDGAVRGTGR